jgi:hypothetical protein
MLGVRTYSVWESFSHDVLILTLAADMAEALLTARGYLEFKSVDDLKGRAKKWIGKGKSPFEKMSKADTDAADDLRVLRNFIVHQQPCPPRCA